MNAKHLYNSILKGGWMKIGIMQPYFFPYLGYYMLFTAVDKYIHFDTPQYERRGWMNRNRIRNLKKEFSYITVPIIKAPQKTPLNLIKIDNTQNWKRRIFNQLSEYKGVAPYYEDTMSFLTECFAKDFVYLSELNIFTLERTLSYLKLHRETETLSRCLINVPKSLTADENTLYITKKMGFHKYINAIGGIKFYDRQKFSNNGIEIQFLNPQLQKYDQGMERFIENLSIIDVLMFNKTDIVLEWLYHYNLV
jgi:hypothetical protein